TGRLRRYRPPAEGRQGDVTVRNDTGVVEGSEISMFYDPMIAKLITHAPTRAEAIEAQADSLDCFVIDGINHNVPLLAALIDHPRFRKGELSTGFLEEEYPDGFAGSRLNDARRRRLAAVALAIHRVERERRAALPGRLRPGEALPWREDWTVILDNERLTVKAVSGQTKVPAEIEMVLEEG